MRAGRAGLAAAIVLLLPPPEETPESAPVEVGVPDLGWAVRLDLPGFTVGPLRLRPDGSGVERDAYDDESGLVVSITVERAGPGLDAAACRRRLWLELERSPVTERTDVHRSERFGLQVLEYRVRSYQGFETDQPHLHALMVRDGMRVEIHLSRSHAMPDDAARFDAVLAGLRVGEPAPGG